MVGEVSGEDINVTTGEIVLIEYGPHIVMFEGVVTYFSFGIFHFGSIVVVEFLNVDYYCTMGGKENMIQGELHELEFVYIFCLKFLGYSFVVLG